MPALVSYLEPLRCAATATATALLCTVLGYLCSCWYCIVGMYDRRYICAHERGGGRGGFLEHDTCVRHSTGVMVGCGIILDAMRRSTSLTNRGLNLG